MAAAGEIAGQSGDPAAYGDLAGGLLAISRLRRLVARPRNRHDVGAAALARLLEARIDRRQHLAGSDQARADGGDEVVGSRLLEVGAHAVEALLGDLVALLMEDLVEERAAELDVLLALARADITADRGLVPARD